MNVYEKAIETYGKDSQMNMVQEESAELIQAISKYKRAVASNDVKKMREARENIIEEMADNYIMMEQLKIMLDITSIEIETYKSMKTNRLIKRMLE